MGVIFLAAGDANRLGCAKPKGLYELSLPKPLTLFEEFIGRVKAVADEAVKRHPNCSKTHTKDVITLYLVISEAHSIEVTGFLEKVDYFGYKKVVLVETTQKINCFDGNGEILMKGPDAFVKSSFGNGEFVE